MNKSYIITFAFLICGLLIPTGCNHSSSTDEKNDNEYIEALLESNETGEGDLIIDSMKMYSNILNEYVSLDSVSNKHDTLYASYPNNIVISESSKNRSDTVALIVACKGDYAHHILKSKENKTELVQSKEDTNYWTVACYILGDIIILLILFILYLKIRKLSKRNNKLFKISSHTKNLTISKEKLPWDPYTKVGNDKYYRKIKISWNNSNIKSENVLEWLKKHYYKDFNKKIESIEKNIEALPNSIFIPVIMIKEGGENDYKVEYSEKSKNGKNKRLKKVAWFKAIPDSIQEFTFDAQSDSIDDLKDNTNDQKSQRHYFSEINEIFNVLKEQGVLEEDKIVELTDAQRIVEEKLNSCESLNSEINKLREIEQKIKIELDKERKETEIKIKKATEELVTENQKLKRQKEDADKKVTVLNTELNKIKIDLSNAEAKINTLNTELENSRRFFESQPNCVKLAEKLKIFFSTLRMVENEVEKISSKLEISGTVSLHNIGKAISEYHDAIIKSSEAEDICFNTDLLSKTGFCLASSNLNKRLISQQDESKRAEDYQYYVYNKLEKLIGASVKMADIFGHLDQSDKVNSNELEGIKSLTKRLIESINSLGFQVNYVELYTSASKYKNIEIEDTVDIDGLPTDTIVSVDSMAINYGTSEKKTKVTVQQ